MSGLFIFIFSSVYGFPTILFTPCINGVLSPSIGMRRKPALIIRLTSLTNEKFERDRHGESKREKGNLRCQIEKLLEFPATFSLDLNLSLSLGRTWKSADDVTHDERKKRS